MSLCEGFSWCAVGSLVGVYSADFCVFCAACVHHFPYFRPCVAEAKRELETLSSQRKDLKGKKRAYLKDRVQREDGKSTVVRDLLFVPSCLRSE